MFEGINIWGYLSKCALPTIQKSLYYKGEKKYIQKSKLYIKCCVTKIVVFYILIHDFIVKMRFCE